MKVLFIASYSGTSGASHSLITLVNILKTKGVEPFVILPTKGKMESELINHNIPYKVIRLFNWVVPMEKKNSKKEKIKWLVKYVINLIQEFRISSLISENNFDLVHINAITAGWGAFAAEKNRLPLIWHIREFLEEDLNKEFRNKKRALKKLNKATTIISISKSVSAKYLKVIPDTKMITIYNGVDQKRFSNIENSIFSRDTITLTIAGRIVKEKGHEETILALKELVESGIKSIRLQIVGSEGNSDFISRIKKIISELNLDDYISFLGYRKDMVNIWSNSDIAIVSSKAEAFGRVTVEAMMSGVLVIGANSGGTAELINNKYGLVYEQGNYKSLAERLFYALNNKSEMIRVAEKAKKHSFENLTADLNAKKIYEVYKNLV
ncbi:glycosyltransferase family 4 protein [Oceanobacillus sp. HCA-5259]|uniref:glycosyltransferase family 4 protein n=1 Tax=Oceanobacillus sp. HCA-5259 TaxID=3134661 RepID=UPI0030C131B3